MNYFNIEDIKRIKEFLNPNKQEPGFVSFATKQEQLKEVNTKTLLARLNVARCSGSYYDGAVHFEIDDLKTQLATRPHVPNKKEGKILRQEAAKKFKGSRNKNR